MTLLLREVAAGAADEAVAPGAAEQLIVAAAAEQAVVARGAAQDVVVGRARGGTRVRAGSDRRRGRRGRPCCRRRAQPEAPGPRGRPQPARRARSRDVSCIPSQGRRARHGVGTLTGPARDGAAYRVQAWIFVTSPPAAWMHRATRWALATATWAMAGT